MGRAGHDGEHVGVGGRLVWGMIYWGDSLTHKDRLLGSNVCCAGARSAVFRASRVVPVATGFVPVIRR